MTDAEKLILYCKFLLTRRDIPFRGWGLGYDECYQPKLPRIRHPLAWPGPCCIGSDGMANATATAHSAGSAIAGVWTTQPELACRGAVGPRARSRDGRARPLALRDVDAPDWDVQRPGARAKSRSPAAGAAPGRQVGFGARAAPLARLQAVAGRHLSCCFAALVRPALLTAVGLSYPVTALSLYKNPSCP
jgi:hypothetical protein